ncbi:hypothetical protein QJS10_CPB20g00905 [Acorus calamus]|uniref:PsbP C-terminal domain-containing protein n=1 Tax=Acorus calamus TaxID=4465 RepID=A0AAV9CEP8_ACOCL|nr:hypothetical protein QJS10_CPB20g00905 [Acorus calamus]
MATSSLQNAPPVHRTPFLNASPSPSSQGLISVGRRRRLPSRVAGFVVRSEQSPPQSPQQDRPGRRQALAIGAVATGLSLSNANPASFAAENKKGFQDVIDRKDGYTFLYPFGWQEVAIQGQDKVFKDVIEPLESVSVNMVPTNKEDIRDLGSPQQRTLIASPNKDVIHQVAEALIKKVLAPSSQKTKLVEAAENDVDGKAYYTFEFIAQAPNYIRHGLGTVSIGNGKFYTVTTGANERRWEKMKDRLHTIIDSFKIFNV